MLRVFMIAALAWGLAGGAFAARVEFDVFRAGKNEGAHIVEVVETADGRRVTTRIDLAGRVGPFSYGYSHRCSETWAGGRLTALDCVDRERGKPEKRVTAAAAEGGLRVTNPKGVATLPADILTTNWWNRDLLRRSELLDTRNGERLPITVSRIGEEQVETPDGPVQATHWRVRGSSPVDIWYDAQGRWVKLAFRLRGQSFEYRLRSPLSAAPAA